MTQIVVNSEAWTGRPFWALDPLDSLLWEIHAFLWPAFDCADCIGMIQHGCYCTYQEGVAPGTGPEPWRAFLRNIFNRVVRR